MDILDFTFLTRFETFLAKDPLYIYMVFSLSGLLDLHLTLRHKGFSEDFQGSFPFKEIGKALETRRSFFLCCFIDRLAKN